MHSLEAVQALVQTAVDLGAAVFTGIREPPSPAQLVDAAKRVCTIGLHCSGSTALSAVRLYRAAAQAVLAGAYPDIVAGKRMQPAPVARGRRGGGKWGTIPGEILSDVLQWLRGDGVGEADPTFRACALVCRGWNRHAMEALWREVDVSAAKLGRLVDARRSSQGSARSRNAMRALHIRLPRSPATFEFPSPSITNFCPNLRCLSVTYIRSNNTLATLALFFQNCPNLVGLRFLCDVRNEGADADFWERHPDGNIIKDGIGRLQFLDFLSKSDAVDTAINSAAGPNLVCWVWPSLVPPAAYAQKRFPKLMALLIKTRIADVDLIAIAACSPQLAVVSLAQCDVTDAGVKSLLRLCPSIKKLALSHTRITVATLHALKSYPPLKMLTLGVYTSKLLAQNEPALLDLLAARGGQLTRLCLTDPDWCPSDAFAESAQKLARLEGLVIIAGCSLSVATRLAQRLSTLRAICVQGEFDVAELRAELPPSVAPVDWRSDFWEVFGGREMDMRLAGITPPVSPSPYPYECPAPSSLCRFIRQTSFRMEKISQIPTTTKIALREGSTWLDSSVILFIARRKGEGLVDLPSLQILNSSFPAGSHPGLTKRSGLV
ncbi:hypothetical protein BDK51DRAFT_51924 [Blyttiomyces helicus]|uniref:F-box domain-containing protein n=1 Tax=Blyttiomyces helicus TaxID=388810 RepID=A0A4P9WEV5_9FUNG|nr:hypothetical protein BDK51DRAFT_51924 [Blyttiomyces helicus]|eukprot:RKO89530.1 hypothetical protein BDK51DRAFT_51924 [Blyttiomyces helicus]